MSLLAHDLNLLKKTHRDTYKSWCTQWLIYMMKNPDKTVVGASPDGMRLGGLYFMQYDLRKVNKTSKLEQFSPILLVDYRRDIDARVLYALNLNFLTTQKKEAFFASFTTGYDSLLETNQKNANVASEPPFPGVNYQRMFKELVPFAFEYAIREYRLELVDQVHAVSTSHLAKFISLDTQQFTGVDEGKLNDIWIAKIRAEGDGGQRTLDAAAIKSNYKRILEELADKFKTLDKRMGQ